MSLTRFRRTSLAEKIEAEGKEELKAAEEAVKPEKKVVITSKNKK